MRTAIGIRHALLIVTLASALLAAFVLHKIASRYAEPVEDLRHFQSWATRIRPLHVPKKSAEPGDWLTKYRENGQTFEQYTASYPNRPDETRNKLYVLPLGELTPTQEQLVRETAEFLSIFFAVPAEVESPLKLESVPPEARRVHPSWGDKQLLTSYVLDDVLLDRLPPDAVAYLALTSEDLWPGEGMNFVFGQASLGGRRGVWSMYRLGDPEAGADEFLQVRRRLLKVAMHETGHMFGIEHCIAYECGMNGSNGLGETDRQPFQFCAECEPKIWWGCRADPVKRYKSLAEFAAQLGLDTEAVFWRESAARLQSKEKE